jgi:hypothetical protein
MKIEQVHIKHKSYYTRVTLGEGKDAKTLGLQHLPGGRCRIYQPFGGTNIGEFESEAEAMAFCQA